MNDATLTELKIVVERAVRPVRATIARKHTMREELLAHLVAIFEEELQKLGDEQAALVAARSRFGDPKALTPELQQVVSRYDRFDCGIEHYVHFRACESALRHAARIAAMPYIWLAIMVLLALPILLIRGRQYEIGRMMFALLAASVVVSAMALVLTLLIHGLRRALFCQPARRSIRLATFYGLVSLVLVPIGNIVLSWAVSRDAASGSVYFLILCGSSLLVPLLLLLVAKGIERDLRRETEWETLEIGDWH
jgi:hypothetical protein